MKTKKQKEHWTQKQKKDADKIFSPKIDYDKEDDILYITWLPQLEYAYSIETSNGYVFDITDDKHPEVKGIEIFDLKEKIKRK